MPIPLHTPRINNNDDTVRLTKVLVEIGAAVHKGDPVIDIETDKASFTVESEHEGYFLGVTAELGTTITVGSVLAWIGSSKDEAIPTAQAANGSGGQKREASLKAMLLLARHGLSAKDIPVSGERLSVSDVEKYVEAHGPRATASAAPVIRSTPREQGRPVEMSPMERGMLRTVEWHRSEAAPGYIEIHYDPAEWHKYAEGVQKAKRLLLNPLLPLMAWKLVQLAKAQPQINATIAGESKYLYDHVNLGFTVQAGERLYLAVVREAEVLNESEFVDRLSEAQRAAMKNTLDPARTSGATIAFSSMARWAVTRHVPLLPPHTALMVAHTAPRDGSGTLGATYDHRVLSGWDVVRVLQGLSRPEDTL